MVLEILRLHWVRPVGLGDGGKVIPTVLCGPTVKFKTCENPPIDAPWLL